MKKIIVAFVAIVLIVSGISLCSRVPQSQPKPTILSEDTLFLEDRELDSLYQGIFPLRGELVLVFTPEGDVDVMVVEKLLTPRFYSWEWKFLKEPFIGSFFVYT